VTAAKRRPRWVQFLLAAASLIVWLNVAMFLGRAFAANQSLQGGGIVIGLLLLLLYAACVRYIEGRAPSELAPARCVPEWLAGFALGFLIFAIVIGVFALCGWYRPIALAWSWSAFFAGLSLCVGTGFTEEIFARGYIFRFAQSGFGTWGGVAISSLAFGFLHSLNPGATIWTSIAIAIEAGVLLACAFALTGRLWLAMGLHSSWNFAEGTIFGTTVSGTHFPSIMLARVDGPALFTGGVFGPEGSIVTVAVCLALSAWFVVRIVREGRVVAPAWVRFRAAAAAVPA
jgi:membrane protease YdiL (CAAX protease family)